jgi:serine/threonine protein phosphatase 1
MRRFVIGDIHGNHKALVQCLERSGFNKEEDQLIQLGDVADGWHEVYECVEELLSIKNLISIKGNHDDWFLEWLKTDKHPDQWKQGGEGTLKSYTSKLGFGYGPMSSGGWDVLDSRKLQTGMTPIDIPASHKEFWYSQIPYYKDDKNNIFVHGGFNRHWLIEEQPAYILWWDRDLFYAALSVGKDNNNRVLKFKEDDLNDIFIGHTATTYWKTNKPMFADRVINIDTGAGWKDKLTIMDVDTKEYWQSDMASDLYPNEKGRG